jgi:hypothetical protein
LHAVNQQRPAPNVVRWPRSQRFVGDIADASERTIIVDLSGHGAAPASLSNADLLDARYGGRRTDFAIGSVPGNATLAN